MAPPMFPRHLIRRRPDLGFDTRVFDGRLPGIPGSKDGGRAVFGSVESAHDEADCGHLGLPVSMPSRLQV